MAEGVNFFPMTRTERFTLLSLILFAAASFAPTARSVEFAGMALFGWMMAALMVISPILTLWAVRRGRRRT
jgi:uncharacterized membrane protein YqjE